jgi:hypothetical protein
VTPTNGGSSLPTPDDGYEPSGFGFVGTTNREVDVLRALMSGRINQTSRRILGAILGLTIGFIVVALLWYS